MKAPPSKSDHWRAKVPGVPGPYVYEPPTMDDDEAKVYKNADAEPIPDWTEEDTMIVHEPTIRFRTAHEAMAFFAARHGRIFQNLSTVKWWAARVRKDVPRP